MAAAMRAISVTAPFGLCPEDPKFWNKGLELIEELINMFEEVLRLYTTAYPPYSGFVYYQKAEIHTKIDGHPIIWSVAANTPSEGRPIVTDILEGGVGVPPLQGVCIYNVRNESGIPYGSYPTSVEASFLHSFSSAEYGEIEGKKGFDCK